MVDIGWIMLWPISLKFANWELVDAWETTIKTPPSTWYLPTVQSMPTRIKWQLPPPLIVPHINKHITNHRTNWHKNQLHTSHHPPCPSHNKMLGTHKCHEYSRHNAREHHPILALVMHMLPPKMQMPYPAMSRHTMHPRHNAYNQTPIHSKPYPKKANYWIHILQWHISPRSHLKQIRTNMIDSNLYYSNKFG